MSSTKRHHLINHPNIWDFLNNARNTLKFFLSQSIKKLKESCMKLVKSFTEFYQIVDPLLCDDFDDLDIAPTSESGLFTKNRFAELVEFCKKNPRFHIISLVDTGINMNKPIEHANGYRLGKGESDPELTYILKMNWRSYENLKILKFNTNKI